MSRLEVTATSANPAVPEPFTYVNVADVGDAVRTDGVTICRETENTASLFGAFER